MKVIRTEMHNPTPTCDEHVGTFFYVSPQKEKIQAEFYINCCPEDPNNELTKSLRVDALNEQFTDQYQQLIQGFNTDIQYVPVYPNPIF